MLLWQEADLSSGVALPLFGVVNAALAVALVGGWAWFLGQLRPERVAHRAILTQEVGAIFYGEAAADL
jgi:hypothetical protein